MKTRKKMQAMNPYLPLYEYVPDGEPRVFDGRVYIYGSHDLAGGEKCRRYQIVLTVCGSGSGSARYCRKITVLVLTI